MLSISEAYVNPKRPCLTTDESNLIRRPVLTNLINHDLPPISPKTRRKSLSGIDTRNTQLSQPPKTFYSPQLNLLAYPGTTSKTENNISQFSSTTIKTNLSINTSNQNLSKCSKTPGRKLNIITSLNASRSTTSKCLTPGSGNYNSSILSYGSFVDSIDINSTTNNNRM